MSQAFAIAHGTSFSEQSRSEHTNREPIEHERQARERDEELELMSAPFAGLVPLPNSALLKELRPLCEEDFADQLGAFGDRGPAHCGGATADPINMALKRGEADGAVGADPRHGTAQGAAAPKFAGARGVVGRVAALALERLGALKVRHAERAAVARAIAGYELEHGSSIDRRRFFSLPARLCDMAKRRQRRIVKALGVVALFLGTLSNDWVGPPQAELPWPAGDQARVLVIATPLPSFLGPVSVHTAFVVREAGPDSSWERYELWQSRPPRGEESWGHVYKNLTTPLGLDMGYGSWVVASFEGQEAGDFISVLRREAPRYEYREVYCPYPGPNSNTFVEAMLRRGGLRAELPSTAIGKDFRGLVGASFSSGGTGVQVDSALVGLTVGLKDGVVFRSLSASIGIDLFPPAVVVPFGDGRLGFDDWGP